MTVIPDGFGVVSYEFMLTGDPEPMYVTHGFSAEVGADPNAYAQAMGNSFTAAGSLIETVANVYRLSRTLIRLGQEDDPPLLGEWPTNVIGGVAQPAVPQNTAYLLRKTSAMSGRSGKGRMYLPGVTEGSVDATGTLLAITVSAINDLCETYLNLIASDVETPAPMYILHDPTTTGFLYSPTPVTGLSCDGRVATQRRRLRR